ncbi:MAG: MerR family transcriptional regulator [Herbinix sp.]|nr:MerR family transcriptional regulator [Herbinix sp.]
MTYSIGQISEILNISISSLRYYDKEGLLPLVNRTPGNIRVFDEADVECLKMIECLKTTGMQLKDIKTFLNGVKKVTLLLTNVMCFFFNKKKRR